MEHLNSPTARHQERKRFGQNFLLDGAVIDRIVRAISPTGNHRFIEIGPGQGALTLPIIEQLAEHATLDLLELDRDLAAQLANQFSQDSRVKLHHLDALHFAFI